MPGFLIGPAPPIEDEFPVNTSSNLCANASVAGAADGGFTCRLVGAGEVYGEHQWGLLSTNSWDVFARSFGGMVPPKTPRSASTPTPSATSLVRRSPRWARNNWLSGPVWAGRFLEGVYAQLL